MKGIELFSQFMVGGLIALSVIVGLAVLLAVIFDKKNTNDNQDGNKSKNN